jgi:uncharacterized protein YqfA (UPF0365 family)
MLFRRKFDIRIALLLIVAITFLTWYSYVPSGDEVGNISVGLIIGLALYILIRLRRK